MSGRRTVDACGAARHGSGAGSVALPFPPPSSPRGALADDTIFTEADDAEKLGMDREELLRELFG